jgi:hypothetical protein
MFRKGGRKAKKQKEDGLETFAFSGKGVPALEETSQTPTYPPSYYTFSPPRVVEAVELEANEANDVNKILILPSPQEHFITLKSTSPYRTVSFDSIAAQIGLIIRPLETFEGRRPRLLIAQLLSEQSRISTWAKDRDVVDVVQLESMLVHLPMVTRHTMLDVCKNLKQWVNSPERAHLSLTWRHGSETAYFKWMIEGYDSLETLRTVSHSLLMIVPFLSNRKIVLLCRPRRQFRLGA